MKKKYIHSHDNVDFIMNFKYSKHRIGENTKIMLTSTVCNSHASNYLNNLTTV